MVYALIGIPLTMLLLTAVVERLLIPTTLLLKWMNTKLGHMHSPFFIRVLHLFIVSDIRSYVSTIRSTRQYRGIVNISVRKNYVLKANLFTDCGDDNRISLSCAGGHIYCIGAKVGVF